MLWIGFQESWTRAADDSKAMGDLLEFIKQLAKDARDVNLAKDVLELLWGFIHDRNTKPETLQLALNV